MSKTSYTGLKVKIVLKLVVLCVLVPVFCLLVSAVWKKAVYTPGKKNEASYVKRCDMYYFDKDYAGLYNVLCLYKIDSDTFDLYWEAANATMAYENFMQWHRAKERGLEDCDEKIELYYNEVMSYAENCRFEENAEVLREYAHKAEEIY